MIQKTKSTYKKEIKQVTDQIISMFKLAVEMKTERYLEILKLILEDEQDQDYFLKYFSN